MNATLVVHSRRDYDRHVGVGVIVLAAFLVLLFFVRPFGNQLDYGKHTKVSADIQGISIQLRLYHSMNDFFPSTAQGLQALVVKLETDPKPKRWYQLFKSKPKDPWEIDYIYRCPGKKNPIGYDLFSAGPDREPDTPDDDWGG